MKLGEYKIQSQTLQSSAGITIEAIIEVHYEESGGLKFQPLVRSISKGGKIRVNPSPLFVTPEQIKRARKEVLTNLATKTDPLHRYIELVIPRRIPTEDTFALVGAYVENPNFTEPSFFLRRIRLGLERWVSMHRHTSAVKFAEIMNPNIGNLAEHQLDQDCRKSLALAGIRYFWIEIISQRETIRDEWDFDSPLTPIAK